ncbi:DUF4178 domain-containing protein [Brevibacterium litoralis]|uniref:DUF4178 domain-containing protein n=1 Tax=Brevibacterium litoralis TaxID=3138935 RepID=UPI0032EF2D76
MKFLLGLVILILVIALVVAIVRFVQASKKKDRPEPASQRRAHDPFAASQDAAGDPRDIKAGDMLEYLGEKYWVRGSAHYQEGGYTWSEHFYQADTDPVRKWLGVEEDDGELELSVWEDRPELEIVPGDKQITVDDVTYTLVEKGTARYRTEGTTSMPSSGGVDYADYEAGAGKLLSIERYDHGKWEVSTGHTVPLGSFTIYPGS